MCCSFWEKFKNSPKTGMGCSTPLNYKVGICLWINFHNMPYRNSTLHEVISMRSYSNQISTVCPRKKLSKFWRHIAQKVTIIWQYPFVEQNVVVFLTCVSNISKIHWSLHKIKVMIKVTYVRNHFLTFSKRRSHACGFSRVQSYTDQDMSSLSDSVLA